VCLRRRLSEAFVTGLILLLSPVFSTPAPGSAPAAVWHDFVREQVAGHLERMWGAPVRFARIEVALAPPRLTLIEVETEARIAGWRTKVAAARLSVTPALMGLVQGNLEWETIELDGLRIEATSEPSTVELPAAAPGQPIVVGRLALSEGEITLRAPGLEVRARVVGQGRYERERRELVGSIDFSDIEARLTRRDSARWRLAGRTGWAWSPRGIALDGFSLRGELGEMLLEGLVSASDSRLQTEIKLVPQALPWALPAELSLEGPLRISGDWRQAEGGGWAAQGEVLVGPARWNELPLGEPRAHWTLDEKGLSLKGIEIPLNPGRARLAAAAPSLDFQTLRIQLDARSVPAALAARLRPGWPALPGSIDAEALVDFALEAGAASFKASGEVRYKAPSDSHWPLRAEVSFEGGAAGLALAGRWHALEASGTLAGTAERPRLELAPTALEAALPLLRPLAGERGAALFDHLRGTVSGEVRADLAGDASTWEARIKVASFEAAGESLGDLAAEARGDPEMWSGLLRLEPDGGASVVWRMEAGRPETLEATGRVDRVVKSAGGVRLRAEASVAAGALASARGEVLAPALSASASFEVERAPDSGWRARASAGDGAQGSAALEAWLDSSGALTELQGGVEHWRLPVRPIHSWLLGGWLDARSDWSAAKGGPLASLRLVSAAADGAEIERGDGSLEWREGALRLALRGLSPPVEISAALTPAAQWPFIAELRAPTSELEVAPGEQLSATLGGAVAVDGTLRPFDWRAQIEIDRFSISSAGVEWLASGPVSGTGSPAGWNLAPLLLSGEAGSMRIEVDPESSGLKAHGTLLMAPLFRWLGEAEVAGEAIADLRWDPAGGARGDVHIAGLRLVSALLPFSLEDLNGPLSLRPGSIQVGPIAGRASGGSFDLEGRVPLPGAAAGWDLRLRADQVTLHQPPGLTGISRLSLLMAGPSDSPLLSGEATIEQGVYSFSAGLMGSQPTRLPLEFVDRLPAFARRLTLQLGLHAESLWLGSEYTRIESRGSVYVSGTPARPAFSGGLAALEGGEVRLNEVRFRVISGRLEFEGGERFDPLIDLVAETERADYTVRLEASGSVQDLQVALRSNPALPTPEIVRLLATGRAPEAGGAGPSTQVVGGLVGEALLDTVEGGLTAFLPLDTFEIDPVAVSSEGDPTTRITLGKRLSGPVSLSYSTSLAGEEDLYQLRYRLQPGLSLITSREEDGSIGGDVDFSRRLYPPGQTPPREEAAQRPHIRRVRFQGKSPFPRRRLRSAVTVVSGERASVFDLRDSEERLWRLHARAGRPQAVIEAEFRPRRRDSADALFRIQPGRPLRILLEGAPLSRALEESLLELWQDPSLRTLAAPRAAQRVSEHFKARGYPSAAARFAGVEQGEEEDTWRFEVRTGRQVRVRAIEIRGAERMEPQKLREVLRTRAGMGGERHLYVAARVWADTRALEDFYARRGFPLARAELLPPEFNPDGDEVTLRWRIVEGPLHQVEEVRIAPEAAEPLAAGLAPDLRLRPGEPFDAQRASEDSRALQRHLDLLGYPQAKVRSRSEGEPGRLIVIYEIEPGPRRMVGEVSVSGNRLTRERVIRRELTFASGEPLSARRLAESEKNLYELGVFRSVAVQPLEPGGAESDASADGVLPVRVHLQETEPLKVGLGVGYDTLDQFRGRVEFSTRNLLGTRRYAGLVLRGGSTEQRAQALLRNPRLFGTRLTGLLSFVYQDKEEESFDSLRRSASLQAEWQPTPRLTMFYGYSVSDEDLSDVQVSVEEAQQEGRLASLGWALAFDRRNNFVEPRRGLFASLDLKWFEAGLGSEFEFGRGFAQLSTYVPLSSRTVWASGLRLGYEQPLGDDTAVPIGERFFAGGDSTSRGFEHDRLGPLDPLTGEPLGGEFLLLLNQEVRFPVWRVVRGVVFYDGGNVFVHPEDLVWRDLRHVMGAGLRVDTPIGPLRLDYGRILDRQEGEEGGQLFFSIGNAF
jgi:outer membrane protein assembly complex protein YaeT